MHCEGESGGVLVVVYIMCFVWMATCCYSTVEHFHRVTLHELFAWASDRARFTMCVCCNGEWQV